MSKRPIEITWRNFEPTESLEDAINDAATKLEGVSEHLLHSRVVLEVPHRSHRHGRHFHVSIDLVVPGTTLVVRRDPAEHSEHEDVYIAVRDAFAAARRQLVSWESKRSGKARRHQAANRSC